MSGIEKVNSNVQTVSDDKLAKGLLYVGTGAVVAAFAIELLPAAIIVLSVKALAAALAGSALITTTGCEQTIFAEEDQCSNSGEPVSANSSREVVTQEIYSCDEPNQTILVKVVSQSCAKDGNNLTLEAYDTSNYTGTVQRKNSDDPSCTKEDNRLTCYFEFPVVPGSAINRSFGATAYGKAQNPNAPFPAFPGEANERPSIPIYDGTNSIQVKKTQTPWPGPITLDAVVPAGYNTHDARIGDTVKLVVNFKDQLDALGVSYKWEHSLAGQTELLDNNSGELNYTLQALGRHTFTVSYTDPNALALSCQPEPYQSQAVNSDFEVREEPSIACSYNSVNNTFYPDPDIANITRGSSQRISWNIPDVTKYLPTTCLTTAGTFSIIDHNLDDFLFDPSYQILGDSLLISGLILPNTSASPIANIKLNDGDQDMDIKAQLTAALDPITVNRPAYPQVGVSAEFAASYVAGAQNYHFVVSQNGNDIWSQDSSTNSVNYIPTATGPYKIRVEVTAYNGELITIGQTSTDFFVNEGAGGGSLADSFRFLTTYSPDGAVTNYPFKVKLTPATPVAFSMIDADSQIEWQISLDGRILSTDEFNAICSTSTTAPTELSCTPTEEGQYAVQATVTHPTNPTIETEFIKLDRVVGWCVPVDLAIGGSLDFQGGTSIAHPIEVLPDPYRQINQALDYSPALACKVEVFRNIMVNGVTITENLFETTGYPVSTPGYPNLAQDYDNFYCRPETPPIFYPVISEAEGKRVYQLRITTINDNYGYQRVVTKPVNVYSPITSADALNFLVIAADNGQERNPFVPIRLRANKTADHYRWEIIGKNNGPYAGQQPAVDAQEAGLEFFELEAVNGLYTPETTNNEYKVKLTLLDSANPPQPVGEPYETAFKVYPFPKPPYALNMNKGDSVHEGDDFFLLTDLGRTADEDKNAIVDWKFYDTADTADDAEPALTIAPTDTANNKVIRTEDHPGLKALPAGIYRVVPTVTGQHKYTNDQGVEVFTPAYEISNPEYLTIWPANMVVPSSGFYLNTAVGSGQSFTCAANNIDNAQFIYNWEFDDGTSIPDNPNISGLKTFNVAPGQIASHAVTLTVCRRDNPLVCSNRTTQNIVVVGAGQPIPNVIVTPNNMGPVPLAVNFNTTASRGADGASIISAMIDFGDGTTPYSGDSSAAIGHTYNSRGHFTVTVQVTDSNGTVSTPITYFIETWDTE
ncbi:MAG: PKD domain-containing protein [bacterium]